jgi:hypothetical protein
MASRITLSVGTVAMATEWRIRRTICDGWEAVVAI